MYVVYANTSPFKGLEILDFGVLDGGRVQLGEHSLDQPLEGAWG